jgi:uncharacterized membrane protein YebE (DUF533 family)
VLLAVTVIAAIAGPVVNAAIGVLEIAAITAASVTVLAAIGGIAYVALRAHNRQAVDHQTIASLTPARQQAAQTLSAPRRLAIEAPRPGLADLQALAAEHGYDIIRRSPEN